MWPWRVKMPTQNRLRLFLLLMLVMRIMLTTVCCRFGSGGLVIKLLLLFRLWAQGLVNIDVDVGCWCLVVIAKSNLGQDFEVNAWLRFWNWNLIKICVRTYFGYELNSQVRCAFGNVQTIKCPFLWCRRIQIQIPKNQICTVLLQSFRSSLSDYGRQCFDPERLLVWKSDFDLLQ